MTFEVILQEAQEGSALLQGPAPRILAWVRGPDSVDFLQRLSTQDVAGMGPGTVAPAAFLTPKGKLVATAWLLRGEERVGIEVPSAAADELLAMLDQYHFRERLELERPSGFAARLGYGRKALQAAGLAPGQWQQDQDGGVRIASLRNGVLSARWHGHEAWLASTLGTGSAGAPPTRNPSDLASKPAPDLEWLRIVSGDVASGIDYEAATLVLEAGLDDHVSLTKGCYVGQEIVARIHTYGHVNRRLCRLFAERSGTLQPGATLLEQEEAEPVGRVTSVAKLPRGGELALGYVARELCVPRARLWIGARGAAEAQVWPFGPANAAAT